MIKSIFLDLDDTLLDFRQAEATALRRTLTELGLEATEQVLQRYHEINKRHWEMLEEGLIDRHQVKTLRFVQLFEEMGMRCDGDAVWKRYEHNLAQGHWFIPGAEALLEKLFGRYDLYLASNGTASVQRSRVASAGIGKYFKARFISEEMGVNKPSAAYFERCFAAIEGFDKAEAVIVGDSLTSDIRGGRNAGIRTVWFNPDGKAPRADIPADYTITALEQLPALLEQL